MSDLDSCNQNISSCSKSAMIIIIIIIIILISSCSKSAMIIIIIIIIISSCSKFAIRIPSSSEFSQQGCRRNIEQLENSRAIGIILRSSKFSWGCRRK